MIDDERILTHPQSTVEIKECIKDLKVLGRREINLIVGWRRHLAASIFRKAPPVIEPTVEKEKIEKTAEEEEDEEEDGVDKDIEEQLLKLNEQQRKEAKRFVAVDIDEFDWMNPRSRKRKHIMKEKRKLRDRLALKMILPGDIHDHETLEGGKNDQGLFDLEKIKTKKVCPSIGGDQFIRTPSPFSNY